MKVVWIVFADQSEGILSIIPVVDIRETMSEQNLKNRIYVRNEIYVPVLC